MNYENLLSKAKEGRISKSEVEQVVAVLQQDELENDPYTLLHIIGLSGFTEYEKVINRYLQSKNDPMLARLALQILCSFWKKTVFYLKDVKAFIHGVELDNEDDVRLIAISIAGEYLRDNEDRELLGLLVDILFNDSIDQILREAAYFALGRAYGKKWEELPSASKHFDLDLDVDSRVLEWAIDKTK